MTRRVRRRRAVEGGAADVLPQSARGTGKTVLAAAFVACGVWRRVGNRTPLSICLPCRGEQAARVFCGDGQVRSVELETLAGAYDVMADRMRIHPNGVRTHGINTRSGDSKAELGLRPTLSVVDELAPSG